MKNFLVCLFALVLIGLAVGQVTDPSFECLEDDQYPHADCWKWYNCGEGIAYVQECPNDWLYDDVNKWCEFPENVDCGTRNPRP